MLKPRESCAASEEKSLAANSLSMAALGQDAVHDFAVYIGQSIVAALEAIGESLVVQAQ